MHHCTCGTGGMLTGTDWRDSNRRDSEQGDPGQEGFMTGGIQNREIQDKRES